MLAAVTAQGMAPLEAPVVQKLGSPDVTEAEIIITLRKCSPHTAPGPDGIPMKLFKVFRRSFAPILAKVFSAIQAPPLENSSKALLPKPGNSLYVANTRPITLLGTDYRVLTRCLGARLGDILPTLIDPVQTAFLKGRNIGDSAMLLQVLPPLLEQQKESKNGLIDPIEFRSQLIVNISYSLNTIHIY